jgi:hypothetical protein
VRLRGARDERARARDGDGRSRGGGRTVRAGVVLRDLKEEEARLLFFEVRDLFSFAGLRF